LNHNQQRKHENMKTRTKTILPLAATICCFGLAGPAMAAITFTDNFDTAHDYTTSGVSGTIWDGVVNAGNVVALNSSTTTSGQLRMQASDSVGWAAGTNNAPFLYLNVTGDFDAQVEVSSQTVGNYNVIGLMARLGDPSANGTAGEDYMSINSNGFGGNNFQSRYLENGVQHDLSGPVLTYPNFLRLTRTGNTFNAFTSTDGTTWTANSWGGTGNDLVRTDLDGLSLQVGLWQGSFTSSGMTADADNFSVTVIPEPSTALLGGLGMLALLRRRR
jgi:hypothetical protein